MKKLIFGGFCFLGGLLLMLVDPSIDAGIIDFLIRILIPVFTIFGFVLSVIGFVKKGDNENK